MATGRQLITATLKLIEATSSEETPEAVEAEDALDRLNEMMDSWNAQRLTTFAFAIALYPLVSGTQDYTIGPTGDFVQQRPNRIKQMGLLQNNNPLQPIRHPLRILNVDQWLHEVPVRAVGSALPTKVYVTYGFPNMTLSFWPFPNKGGLEVEIYTEVNLTPWPDLDTDLTFPPGYIEAIRYNLALRLCPEFGRDVNNVVGTMALESMGIIKASNLANHQQTLKVDEALIPGQVFDWRIGDPQ
jgi:hypothetical protein